YVNNVVGGEGRAVVVPVVAAALFVYAITLVLSSVRDRRARRSARRH
ncbi:MAG: signal peptidase I, partial [Burkholderiaceae bacterium]|nr:signal peptidase I [Microbacteriaceae bacterium]